ncbi:unnamed protein product [Rotaria sp. Silwood1]|nr:unnamed protein product [Rotaria sp. Silwood1]CAF1158063.1 unnamed protein product [Rotaria sp. Silwood1]CAF4523268.1 unnamed protein product [Rotaria sp. Silwood1]
METNASSNVRGNVHALRNMWISKGQEEEKPKQSTVTPSYPHSKQQQQKQTLKDNIPTLKITKETITIAKTEKESSFTFNNDKTTISESVEKVPSMEEKISLSIPSSKHSIILKHQTQSKTDLEQSAIKMAIATNKKPNILCKNPKTKGIRNWQITRLVFRSGLALNKMRRASDTIVPLLMKTYKIKHCSRADSTDSIYSQPAFETYLDYFTHNTEYHNHDVPIPQRIKRSASYTSSCMRRNKLDETISQYEMILRHLKNYDTFASTHPLPSSSGSLISSQHQQKSFDIQQIKKKNEEKEQFRDKIFSSKQQTQSLSRNVGRTFSEFIMNDLFLSPSLKKLSHKQQSLSISHASSQTDLSEPIHNIDDQTNNSSEIVHSLESGQNNIIADEEERVVINQFDAILNNNDQETAITPNSQINVIVANLPDLSEKEKTVSTEKPLMQRLFEGKKTVYSPDDLKMESIRLPEEMMATYEIAKNKCFFDSEKLIYTTKMIKIRRRGYTQHIRMLCITTERLYNITKKNPYPKEGIFFNQIMGITCTPYKDGFICIHTKETYEDRGDWLVVVDHPCEFITQLFMTMRRDDNSDGFLKFETQFTHCRRFFGEGRKGKNKQKDASDFENLKKEVTIDEHKITLEELVERYETNIEEGHSSAKARDLLEKNGPNALTPPPEVPEWIKFAKLLFGGFSALLWVAAILCLIAYGAQVGSDPTTPKDNLWLGIALLVVVIITAIFAYYQESKAGKIMESFKKMVPQQAVVMRDGQKIEISAQELVVGDIVFVKIGDKTPADIRVLSSQSFKVDNSSLTGESEPLARSPDCTHDSPLETKNLAFFSTFAVEGSCTGMVIRTGDNTVMGRIAALASGLGNEISPLNVEINHFVHIVTVVAVTFGVIFLIILLALGTRVLQAIVFVIGIIVSNVPEGLLATITVMLALTAQRMAKKKCLVKNLTAVEALGSVSTICSDKTGTLTQNRMTVAHLWLDSEIVSVNLSHTHDAELVFEKPVPDSATGQETTQVDPNRPGYKALIRCAMLCAKAVFKPDEENMSKPPLQRQVQGDASETAILQFSEIVAGKVEEYRAKNKRVCDIPFNSANKYQVSIHETDDDDERHLVVMKGAPERILERCQTIFINNNEYNLDDEWKQKFNDAYMALGGLGERVLGFCDLRLPLGNFPRGFNFDPDNVNFPLRGLRFLGFITMIDPPRPGVADAVAKCRTAGIKVIMVTGDHPITAKAIAKGVGIITSDTAQDLAKRLNISPNDVDPRDVRAIVVSGAELSELSSHQLDEVLTLHREIVFARTSPQQKLIIVEGCQRQGWIVGVTGDGVNDSPALKKADIGISMGITGSDVSKQVADMILLDDNFATIVTGIEEGRLIFDNLKKVIAYTFTKNLVELLPFLVYVVADVPLALSTITILCIDLGTDIVPSIAYAYEGVEADILKRPPRKRTDKMVTSQMVTLCYGQIAMVEASGAFFAYLVVMAENGFWPSRLIGLREAWESTSVNDLRDSYGQEWTYEQRHNLDLAAQAAYFIGVVITQFANLYGNKTKRRSVFQQGLFSNRFMVFAILFTIALACFLLYIPTLNRALNLNPNRFLWWLPPIPFFVYLFAFNEARKFFIRKYPDRFAARQLTY